MSFGCTDNAQKPESNAPQEILNEKGLKVYDYDELEQILIGKTKRYTVKLLGQPDATQNLTPGGNYNMWYEKRVHKSGKEYIYPWVVVSVDDYNYSDRTDRVVKVEYKWELGKY